MGPRGSSGKVVQFIKYILKLGVSPVALARFKKCKVGANASQKCKYKINKHFELQIINYLNCYNRMDSDSATVSIITRIL
jgi:hypothetical protein